MATLVIEIKVGRMPKGTTAADLAEELGYELDDRIIAK